MNIKDVIKTVAQMEVDGVIERYAIGGAVGATFYLEPVATLDIDIFVAFKSDQDSIFVDPRPVYDYLKSRGCSVDGEYLIISGWPVQFLPPNTPLVEEALAQSVDLDVDGLPARVFTPEHLAAVALQTGRAKDKARLLQFVEAGVIDMKRFNVIVERFSLSEAWDKFKSVFLDGDAL